MKSIRLLSVAILLCLAGFCWQTHSWAGDEVKEQKVEGPAR